MPLLLLRWGRRGPANVLRSLASFRAVLAFCALLCVCIAPPGAGAETLSTVTARPADAFVDSVGINIHSHYNDTAYASLSHVISLLKGLDIRHVRDGWVNTENPDGTPNGDTMTADAWTALRAAGIGVTDLVGAPLTGSPWSASTADVAQRVNEVAALNKQTPGVVDALEGPNEWDQSGDPSWKSDDVAYQQALAADAKNTAPVAALPVVAPSLAQPSATLDPLSGAATQGNLHFYPGADRPETLFDTRLGAHNPTGTPTVTTEAGYTTGYVPGQPIPPGTPPVDEAAQATYLPRLLAEGFRDGSARTFLYELLDTIPGSYGTTPTVPDDANQHFGLVRADYTPKPAYGAVARLLGLLADPAGAHLTPSKLVFGVSAPAANDIRTVVLQRSDGTFQLLVWRGDTTVFQGGNDVAPASVPVTLDLLSPVSQADAYTPTTGTHDVLATSATTQLTLSLGANLEVIDLTPAAGQAISCAPASYATTISAAKPSLWLPLDEQSGAPHDAAGRGASVTGWSSAPTYRVPGSIGDGNGATGVSGSQRVVATLPAALSSGTGFTLEAWVEPSSSTPAYSRFLTTDAGAWSVLMRTYTGALGSAYGNAGEIVFPGLTPGTWHHVALVVSGAGTLLYLDGRLAGSTSSGGAVTIRKLTLGSVEANGFIGGLDEVAAYPRALPAAEVASHYCIGRISAPAGYAATVRSDKPVAFLRLGEKSGAPVDSAGQGATAGGWSAPPTYGAPAPLAGDATTSVRVGGSANVTLGLPHPLTSAAGFTIEAWVMPDAATPDGSRFLSSDAGSYDVMLRTYAMAGADPLASAYGGGNEIIYHGLTPGVWHQLDLVVGPTGSSIYLDGRWSASTTNVSSVTLAKLTLGSQPTVGWDQFIGDLADVSVYPAALTFDRIAAHYAAATS